MPTEIRGQFEATVDANTVLLTPKANHAVYGNQPVSITIDFGTTPPAQWNVTDGSFTISIERSGL